MCSLISNFIVHYVDTSITTAETSEEINVEKTLVLEYLVQRLVLTQNAYSSLNKLEICIFVLYYKSIMFQVCLFISLCTYKCLFSTILLVHFLLFF